MKTLPACNYVISLGLLWFCHSSAFSQIDFASVENNVSFAGVNQLEFREADYTLSYGSEEYQYGRLWLPDLTHRSNLLIFIHGGCWLNEFDMSHTYPLATALAQAGYAVWSLEYRRTGDIGGGWPGTYNDIKAGIVFAENLVDFGTNTDNMVILGHSAGGHLALLAGSEFSNAKGVIGLAAITDIEKYAMGSNSCETATPQFMGGFPDTLSEQYRAANPAKRQLHKQSILLHGSMDSIVDVSQSSIQDTSKAVVDGAGHFDWVHPGTESVKLLLDVLEDLY